MGREVGPYGVWGVSVGPYGGGSPEERADKLPFAPRKSLTLRKLTSKNGLGGEDDEACISQDEFEEMAKGAARNQLSVETENPANWHQAAAFYMLLSSDENSQVQRPQKLARVAADQLRDGWRD